MRTASRRGTSRRTGQGRRRAYRIRLRASGRGGWQDRAGQGPAAAAERGRVDPGPDVEQYHLRPEGHNSRGRESRRPAGPASQRSSRADQPRFPTDHGHPGGLEETHRDRGQPRQRHHLRLRSHARNGRGSGGGLPLLRQPQAHQPRALPQRHREEALREVRRGVPGRGPGGHVRRHARAGSGQVQRHDLPGASARVGLRSRTARIPAAVRGRRRLRRLHVQRRLRQGHAAGSPGDGCTC